MEHNVDIFISYKREERSLANQLASALERSGYTHITDMDIDVGDQFGDAIDKMIRRSRLVLVLWTEKSSTSVWVKDEARLAVELGIYGGIFLDDVQLPFDLKFRQNLHLVGKEEDETNSKIIEYVEGILGPGKLSHDLAAARSESISADLMYFQTALRIDTIEKYKSYLKLFPGGYMEEEAKENIKRMKTKWYHVSKRGGALISFLAIFVAIFIGVAQIYTSDGMKFMKRAEFAEKERDELHKNLVEVRAAADKQAAQLKLSQVVVAKYEADDQKNAEVRDSLKNELAALQGVFDEQTAKLERANAAAIRYETDISQLFKERDRLKRELAAIRDVFEERTAKLKRAQAAASQSKRDILGLTKERDGFSSELAALRFAFDEQAAKSERGGVAGLQSREDLLRLSGERDGLVGKLAQMQGVFGEQSAKLERVLGAVARHEANIRNLTSERDDLARKLAEIQRESGKPAAKVANEQGAIVQKNMKNARLSSNVSRLGFIDASHYLSGLGYETANLSRDSYAQQVEKFRSEVGRVLSGSGVKGVEQLFSAKIRELKNIEVNGSNIDEIKDFLDRRVSIALLHSILGKHNLKAQGGDARGTHVAINLVIYFNLWENLHIKWGFREHETFVKRLLAGGHAELGATIRLLRLSQGAGRKNFRFEIELPESYRGLDPVRPVAEIVTTASLRGDEVIVSFVGRAASYAPRNFLSSTDPVKFCIVDVLDWMKRHPRYSVLMGLIPSRSVRIGTNIKRKPHCTEIPRNRLKEDKVVVLGP